MKLVVALLLMLAALFTSACEPADPEPALPPTADTATTDSAAGGVDFSVIISPI